MSPATPIMLPSEASEPLVATPELRRRHIVAKAIAVGLVAGLVGAGFRLSLDFAERTRDGLAARFPGGVGLLILSVLGAFGGGMSVWLVRRFAPHASGSGVPHVKAVLSFESPPEWKRMLPVKFLSGVLAIGAGFALGREGPTIQMGGGVGGMLAEWFRVRRGEGERRALIRVPAQARGWRPRSTRRSPAWCSSSRNCTARLRPSCLSRRFWRRCRATLSPGS